MGNCQKCQGGHHQCNCQRDEIVYVKTYIKPESDLASEDSEKVRQSILELPGVEKVSITANEYEILYDDRLINEETLENKINDY